MKYCIVYNTDEEFLGRFNYKEINETTYFYSFAKLSECATYIR